MKRHLFLQVAFIKCDQNHITPGMLYKYYTSVTQMLYKCYKDYEDDVQTKE